MVIPYQMIPTFYSRIRHRRAPVGPSIASREDEMGRVAFRKQLCLITNVLPIRIYETVSSTAAVQAERMGRCLNTKYGPGRYILFALNIVIVWLFLRIKDCRIKRLTATE